MHPDLIEDSLPPATQPKDAPKNLDRDYFVCGRVNGERWLQKLPPGAQAKAILHAGTTVYVAAAVTDPVGVKGMLYRFDAITGAARGTISLPASPVFDGLSVGQGCIFVAAQAALYCLSQP
jgi:hypothetical protein